MRWVVLLTCAAATCAVGSLYSAHKALAAVERIERSLANPSPISRSEIHAIRAELEKLRTELPRKQELVAAPDVRQRRSLVSEERPETREDDEPVRQTQARLGILDEFDSLSMRARAEALGDLVRLAGEGNQRALDLLLATLSNADSDIRFDAIEAIGESGNPELITQLQPFLQDPEPEARFLVAEALGNMPADRAGPFLEKLLDDDHEWVVAQSLRSIRSLDYQAALPSVGRIARGSDLNAAARAAAVLGEMGDTATALETLDRLVLGLSSPDAVERIDTIRRLEHVGGQQVIDLLEQIRVSDVSDAVRLEARDALEELLMR